MTRSSVMIEILNTAAQHGAQTERVSQVIAHPQDANSEAAGAWSNRNFAEPVAIGGTEQTLTQRFTPSCPVFQVPFVPDRL